MSQLINIYDDGFTKDHKGRNVGVIRFRIVTGEGKPDDILGHCFPAYKDSVVKNLQRLAFPKDNHNSTSGVEEKAIESEL